MVICVKSLNLCSVSEHGNLCRGPKSEHKSKKFGNPCLKSGHLCQVPEYGPKSKKSSSASSPRTWIQV